MGIAMFALGGTISAARPASSDGNGDRRLTGADITAGIPGLLEVPQALDVYDVRAVPSSGLTFAHMLDVVAEASRAVQAGATGVVVTQGTDTLEETAYLVDLVWPHSEPFVLTGAMRNPTLAGPDGPANVLAAVRTAASSEARDLGAVVVFNDEIHAARWVRKQHSTSTSTFGSPNSGPLGHVVEGTVRILVRPSRAAPLPWPDADRVATTQVALYTVTLDDDARLLDALVGIHHGLVLAGFGVGHVPAEMASSLEALAERMPVVLTSRTGSGSVLRHTYGAIGSEIDLQRRGLLNGGLLDPYKARVLLRMLLATGSSRDQISDQFAMRG